MNRVVVVGASAGGLATAEALRRFGFERVLTLIGDEPGSPATGMLAAGTPAKVLRAWRARVAPSTPRAALATV